MKKAEKLKKLKDEGKLLTKAQKEAKAKADAFREMAIAQGLVPAASGEVCTYIYYTILLYCSEIGTYIYYCSDIRTCIHCCVYSSEVRTYIYTHIY